MFWKRKVAPVTPMSEYLEMKEQYEKKIQEMTKDFEQIKENATKIEEERNELLGKIRKQTEADLYFVSMKIMKEFEKGKSKTEKTLQSLLSRQEQLRSLQRAQVTVPVGLSHGLGGAFATTYRWF